ncbi:MAG: hypothetical protein JRG73_03635 [Deltaproteobacteria bacterium]|nr:hypothetical protein [Deltaproteobacteria bacterium]
MRRKIFCNFKVLAWFAVFLVSPVLIWFAVSLAIDGFPGVTPSTIISRIPMVQDSSDNSDFLVLTNFRDSTASATVSLYDTTGGLTAVTVSVDEHQVSIVDISEVSLVQGIYSLEVDAPESIHSMVITGPSDFHSISLRKLTRGSLSTETRTLSLPMMAHFEWASGDLFLANFDDRSAVVSITVYDLTGTTVTERELTLGANAILQITAEELIGAGQEGIFSAIISAPGTVLGVYTVTDPDNDKGYYPLGGEPSGEGLSADGPTVRRGKEGVILNKWS